MGHCSFLAEPMKLFTRQFTPYFVTQALGALNDNIFKNTLVLLLTYQALRFDTELGPGSVASLAAGLFILPFALFSGAGGHFADHTDKAKLIRILKSTELFIMVLASIGLWLSSFNLLMLCVFLMGTQSAFFGPVKHSILPAALEKALLMKANAWVEMATFLMILLGTILAGVLAATDSTSLIILSILGLSLAGLISSRSVPACPPLTTAKWQWPILWQSNTTAFKAAREVKSVWLSVLGISWFWFIGALVLAQLPDLAKNYLLLDESGLTWLLALFSVGVGLGSLVCEKLSGDEVEIGLVPLGALGLTIGLYQVFSALPIEPAQTLIYMNFWSNPSAIATGLWLAISGLFGGLYIVPLYALIQTRAPAERMASVVAANNIMNAAFMVISAILGLVCAQVGLSTPWLILFAALFNAVVATYTYTLVPEFLWRFVVWILVHTVYRFKVRGGHHIPKEGACIAVCNHIGFSDAVILGAACRRPLRFIMDHRIFKNPLLGWFFRTAKAIPIAPKQEDPELFEQSFVLIKQALDDGEIVCIFPEGKLTPDGQVGPFKPGLLRILEQSPVPVVPMALSGLWGSLFTRRNKGWLSRIIRREQAFGRPVDLHMGMPIPASEVNMESLRDTVLALRTRP